MKKIAIFLLALVPSFASAGPLWDIYEQTFYGDSYYTHTMTPSVASFRVKLMIAGYTLPIWQDNPTETPCEQDPSCREEVIRQLEWNLVEYVLSYCPDTVVDQDLCIDIVTNTCHLSVEFFLECTDSDVVDDK